MATTWFEIPLSPNSQSFYIKLGVITYNLSFTFRNYVEGGWFLDIADSNLNPIIQGIPLVTGADLLAQYPDKGFAGKLIASTDGNSSAVPTYQNLGLQSHVYFGVVS